MSFGPLVTTDFLVENLESVFVFDSRHYLDDRDGAQAYADGHIPTAVFVDVDEDLSAPPSQPGGRHPFPTAEEFVATMGRLGYDGKRPAVIYDDCGGGIAGRLWFMLKLMGCHAAVLDGGYFAWPGERSTELVVLEKTTFEPRSWPTKRLIDADEVQRRLDAGGVVVDSRNRSRYIGKPNRIDDRFGHIPGAINLAWEDNVDDFTGTMLSLDDLDRRFDAVLDAVDQGGERPVFYCGSGVSACNNLLVMDLLGYGEEADLYVGSWSEWGADETRPLATTE